MNRVFYYLPPYRAALLLLGLALAAPSRASAGNWTYDPALSEAGTYSSNVLMRTASAISLYGSETTAALAIAGKTPTDKLSVDTRVTQNLFDKSAYNSTDAHNTTAFKRQVERWGTGLSFNGDYDTTRTSEISTFGVAPKSVRHWGGSLAPELSFRPNARNEIALSGAASLSRYNETLYTDYNVYSARTTYSHFLSPTMTGMVFVNARRYETQNNVDERVDSIGPSAGFSYALNERFSTQVSGGAETSKRKREGLADQEWLWSSVFSAGVTYTGEQDRLNIKASREQQPYGNGTSSLLTSISASERHAINSALSLAVGGRYARAQQSGLSSSTLENQWSANAGMAYAITSDVDVDASYRYREESYRTTDAKARDNAVMLRLTYKPIVGSD